MAFSMKSVRARIVFALFGVILAAVPTARAGVKEAPVPIRTVSPHYPDELRAQSVSGLVMVQVNVDAQGTVADAVVLKSSHDAFNGPAIDALKRWKFKPAREDGKPIAIVITVPVKFAVDDAG